MAVAVQNDGLLTDGDAAFLRVDNRRPAHALEPGVVASATNKRFDQGKPGPRYGVAADAWGMAYANLVSGDWGEQDPHNHLISVELTGFVVGKTYSVALGNADYLSATEFATTGTITEATFEATQTTYYLTARGADKENTAITTIIHRDAGNTLAYKRFNDPNTDTDNAILLTDDWRDGAGEDGGRGRAWRILSGNGPQEISLNGHDLWDTCRLVQCHNAMVLCRHGNERHYFVAADVDTTGDTIELHCAPSWGQGTGNAKRVRFELAEDASAIYGSSAPAPGNYYYAKYTLSGGAHLIELYTDNGCTNKLVFDTSPAPNGKFYVELAGDPEPWFGNGAPCLIMQPSLDGTAFANGFVSVSANVNITSTTTSVITAENHRFIPGDSVSCAANSLKVSTGPDVFVTWPKYAAPRSAHTLRLYTSQAAALADDGSTGLQTLVAAQSGISIFKTSAAGLALPPCREGCYYKGRFIGVVGRDTIVISDPFDFLHYTSFVGNVAANLGESGTVNWLVPLGEDTLLIGKTQKVLALAGLSQAPANWTMEDVTTEFGGIAALAALNVGSDVWCLSRKGVASIVRTQAGQRLAITRTVSHSIPQDLGDVDWLHAPMAASEIWNNRYFLAVPLKGQTDVVNNAVLVHNFLNQTLTLQQTVVAGQIVGMVQENDPALAGAGEFAWEGTWTGERLTPAAFAKLTVNGEERLTFATPTGQVCWLHDGWDDVGAEISDELVTRGYFGSREVLALKGALQLETFNPEITASVRTAGVNEESVLAGFDPLTRDRTKYLTDGTPDYDPSTSTEEQFDAPHREDYSPTAEELSVARPDVHQAITEPFRCRERDYGVQLVIANARGSTRIAGTMIQGKPVGIAATRKS